MQKLRGKVVLVDFWTYSCINCLRTLPQLEAWDAKYRKDGLVIVGVHTPEFAFEHVSSNVDGAVERLDVRYPVVQDNDYKIWNAYSNQYWPAEYLIDKQRPRAARALRRGRVRPRPRTLIRKLLGVDRGTMTRGERPRRRSGALTPESYIGYARADRFVGEPRAAGAPGDVPLSRDRAAGTTSRSAASGRCSGARGRRRPARSSACDSTRRRCISCSAARERCTCSSTGSKQRTVRVNGDRLYTLVDSRRALDALLELRFTPGVSAYAFTFG